MVKKSIIWLIFLILLSNVHFIQTFFYLLIALLLYLYFLIFFMKFFNMDGLHLFLFILL